MFTESTVARWTAIWMRIWMNAEAKNYVGKKAASGAYITLEPSPRKAPRT